MNIQISINTLEKLPKTDSINLMETRSIKHTIKILRETNDADVIDCD